MIEVFDMVHFYRLDLQDDKLCYIIAYTFIMITSFGDCIAWEYLLRCDSMVSNASYLQLINSLLQKSLPRATRPG